MERCRGPARNGSRKQRVIHALLAHRPAQVLSGQRAEYGEEVVPTLAGQLARDYGNSFTEKNLRVGRQGAASEMVVEFTLACTILKLLKHQPSHCRCPESAEELMVSINEYRHQTIELAILQHPSAMVNTTIDLWRRLASTVIMAIGEGGFQSLFSRSIHVTGRTFPWLTPGHSFHATESVFAGLRIALEEHNAAEASAASVHLFNAFIDILVLLVGALLTASILNAAWGEQRQHECSS